MILPPGPGTAPGPLERVRAASAMLPDWNSPATEGCALPPAPTWEIEKQWSSYKPSYPSPLRHCECLDQHSGTDIEGCVDLVAADVPTTDENDLSQLFKLQPQTRRVRQSAANQEDNNKPANLPSFVPRILLSLSSSHHIKQAIMQHRGSKNKNLV